MSKDAHILSKSNKLKMESLLKTALADVSPTSAENENTKRAINIIMERLKLVTPRNVEILLAGSVARGTHVKGNFDIDIFLLFPRSMNEEIMEKKGLEIAKKVVKNKDESYSIRYAEHPYTKLVFGSLGVEAEIVPAYKISNIAEKSTAVDRTQLHNEFVLSTLTEKQRGEVRLLKTFLHAHGVYGAEARIEGFSGYLCEILICYFGSFTNAMAYAAGMKLPLAIDVLHKKEYAKGSKEIMSMLGEFSHNFIVLDPTDEHRNVAANVSDESLSRLIIAARALMKNPGKLAFYGKGYSDTLAKAKIAGIRKSLGVDVHLLSFKLPDIAEDITWQQLKRLNSRMVALLKHNGFEPVLVLQNIDNSDAIIAFLTRCMDMKSRVVEGPSVIIREAYEQFVKAHGNSMLLYLENDRIRSIEPPKHKTPQELLRSFISDKKEVLPSYLNRKGIKLYGNNLPENYAKMLYKAYIEKRAAP